MEASGERPFNKVMETNYLKIQQLSYNQVQTNLRDNGVECQDSSPGTPVTISSFRLQRLRLELFCLECKLTGIQ